MLLKLTLERRFVAGTAVHANDWAKPAAAARKSAAQFVLDLAVDALELGGKILDQQLQTPLAAVDDLPQLGALTIAEPFVGELDSGLDDFAAPRLRARVDFAWYFGHALNSRRAASGTHNATGRDWLPAGSRHG